MSENKEHTAEKDAKTDKKIRKGPKITGSIILTVAVIAGAYFGTIKIIDSIQYVGTDDAADGRQVKLSSKIMRRINELEAAEGRR